jgi:uncharacterized protein HemX
VDYELVKFIARWTVIGNVVGIGGAIILTQMGLTLPAALVVLAVGWGAFWYMKAKAEQKEQEEAVAAAQEEAKKATTAMWQEAYKAGFEEALKQKAG